MDAVLYLAELGFGEGGLGFCDCGDAVSLVCTDFLDSVDGFYLEALFGIGRDGSVDLGESGVIFAQGFVV